VREAQNAQQARNGPLTVSRRNSHGVSFWDRQMRVSALTWGMKVAISANYEFFKNFPEHLNFIYDLLLHSKARWLPGLTALHDPTGAAGGRKPALLTHSSGSYFCDPLTTTLTFFFKILFIYLRE